MEYINIKVNLTVCFIYLVIIMVLFWLALAIKSEKLEKYLGKNDEFLSAVHKTSDIIAIIALGVTLLGILGLSIDKIPKTFINIAETYKVSIWQAFIIVYSFQYLTLRYFYSRLLMKSRQNVKFDYDKFRQDTHWFSFLYTPITALIFVFVLVLAPFNTSYINGYADITTTPEKIPEISVTNTPTPSLIPLLKPTDIPRTTISDDYFKINGYKMIFTNSMTKFDDVTHDFNIEDKTQIDINAIVIDEHGFKQIRYMPDSDSLFGILTLKRSNIIENKLNNIWPQRYGYSLTFSVDKDYQESLNGTITKENVPALTVHVDSVFSAPNNKTNRSGTYFTIDCLSYRSQYPLINYCDDEDIESNIEIYNNKDNVLEIYKDNEKVYLRLNGMTLDRPLHKPKGDKYNIGFGSLGVYISDFAFYVEN